MILTNKKLSIMFKKTLMRMMAVLLWMKMK